LAIDDLNIAGILVCNKRPVLEHARSVDRDVAVRSGNAVIVVATGDDKEETNASSQEEYCPLQTRTSLMLLIKEKLGSF
jgi:hypothetical protein